MNKSIFPTFNEVDNGVKSFTEHYYRSVNGKKVRSERLTQKVLVVDLETLKIIDDISIVRNKRKKRLYFTYKVFGRQCEKKFPYSEQGWQDCIYEIKKELQRYRKSIERIMNEGYDVHTSI